MADKTKKIRNKYKDVASDQTAGDMGSAYGNWRNYAKMLEEIDREPSDEVFEDLDEPTSDDDLELEEFYSE